MTRTPIQLVRRRACREDGFVLVGFVTFTVVLTILGLSLFSLASFEAQLAVRQQHEEAAFYAAVGGLERAKFALVKGDSLASVKRYLPIQGVTYARAMQGTDSAGKVQWYPDSVLTLRVLAVDGPARKLLEARFRPIPGFGLYKHLYTASGKVTAKNSGASDSTTRWINTLLTGNVWQNDADTSWSTKTRGSHSVYHIGGVPPPNLDAFFDAHWAGALGPVTPGNSHNYSLKADENGSNQWQFFKSPYGLTNSAYGGSLNGYALDDTTLKQPGASYPNLQVSGKAVWMLDRGVRFREQLVISATTANDTPMVVIVAKKGQDPANPNVGIWFRGAVDAMQGGNYCAVVLVSDGKVIIEHATGTTDHSAMPYLSVYASDIEVMGPNGTRQMEHDHYLTAGEDSDPQGAIDHIATLGLLPMAASKGSGFTFVSSSWREIASSSGN